MDIWSVLGLLGAAQAWVVGAALLTTTGLARRLFGLLLIDLGVAMAAITHSHLVDRQGVVAGLVEDSTAIFGAPLFYLFVLLASRGPTRAGQPRFWPHLVLPSAWTIYVLSRLADLHPGPRPPVSWLVLFQVAYTLAAARRAFLVAPDASASRSEMRLARLAVFLFAAIHGAQFVRFFVDRPPFDDIVPLTAATSLLVLTFLAARESRVFAALDTEPRMGDEPVTKYEGSSLSDEQAQAALIKLSRAMEEERIFLEADLGLDRLADHLGLARTYLSQVINERCGCTFPEYLARYRVAEAKRLLADPQKAHLTVDALGDRAGFQSRSAFYAAFKKATGQTPAAFRKSAR